ncbi:PAS domain-containing protein [Sphingomonas changnyeongensis]|uniref:histidine kinase n=1 Tax=Sphingomonas changnyeongensis TaxID=2698679 RepID=A0A7Z2S9Q7_9SPHN|nr:ATP-binding protein [Sphingomonas changnyeongensis]QHL91019.1 PAS domain-containing protein [Sphingomonas changnyeongensis]
MQGSDENDGPRDPAAAHAAAGALALRALDAAEEAVWDWDVTGDRISPSGGWPGCYALPRDGIGVLDWRAHVHQQDHAELRDWAIRLVKGIDRCSGAEIRLRTPDGGWRWVLLRGRVTARDAAGRALRALGTAGRIDARKEDERRRAALLALHEQLFARKPEPGETLAAAGAVLGHFLDARTVGLIETDADQAVALVRTAWTTGGPPPPAERRRVATLGRMLADALSGDEAIALPDLAAGDLRRTSPFLAGLADLGIAAALFLPMPGRPARALLFALDTSPRGWSAAEIATGRAIADRLGEALAEARALTALRTSEQRMAQAMTAAGFGVWQWDLLTHAFDVSDGFGLLFGRPPNAVRTAETFFMAVHPDDRDRVRRECEQLWSRDGPALLDVEYRAATTRDGPRWLRAKGSVVERDRSGAPISIGGLLFDITDRKLADSDRDTAQQVALRASRLSAMGALASTLAHELNQPLASTANYLAAARLRLRGAAGSGPQDPGPATDAGADALALVMHATDTLRRASEIIRRMRRFTLSGEVSRSLGQLPDIVAAAWEQTRMRETAAGVALGLDIAADATGIDCDVLQIEQVIGNILRNACDAMAGCADRRILIRARREGGDLLIVIADTGPGLAPEAEARLFEPFRTTKDDGTGLGLAICRTVIEAHGGTIVARRAETGGAAFHIRLPNLPLPSLPLPSLPTHRPIRANRIEAQPKRGARAKSAGPNGRSENR